MTATSVSPNRPLSVAAACDSQVKEERDTKAAEILPREEMSADSYLGTPRYQNPKLNQTDNGSS